MRRAFYYLITLVQFFMFGCGAQAQKQDIADKIPVKAVRVEPTDMYDTLSYAGDIKAMDEAIVYPKVSGKIIEKVKDDGSPISKGEAICYIDRDEVGLKFQKAPVESPLTGLVGRVFVDIGENVTPQSAVAFVVNTEKVKVTVDIPEKYTPKISLFQQARVRVDAWPKEEFTGQVTKVSPVVDLSTRSSLVEITIDNPEGKLKSGMFAKVQLVLDTKKGALPVLQEAIIGRGEATTVFIVENNKATLKKVTLGLREGPYYEITSGIRGGDLVVIMGQQKLYEGALVEAEVVEK